MSGGLPPAIAVVHLLQRVVGVAVELRLDVDVGVRGVELADQRLDRRALDVGVAVPEHDVRDRRREPDAERRPLRTPRGRRDQRGRKRQTRTLRSASRHLMAAPPIGSGYGGGRGRGRGPGERDGRPLGEHELGQRVAAVRGDRRARPAAAASSDAGVDGAHGHTSVSSAATLIGPWRYSIAGYDSAHAPPASRSFSAASSARPTVQPCPRNTNRSTVGRVDRQRRLERALGRVATRGPTSMPSAAQQQRERRRREPRLHDRLLVGEVEHDAAVAASTHRRVGDRGDHERWAPPGSAVEQRAPPRWSCRSARSRAPGRRCASPASRRRRTRRSRLPRRPRAAAA